MNKSILFFSKKIEDKYKIYINYDISEMILNKIEYNLYQINITKEKLKCKLKKYNKLLNIRSPKVFDSYILHKKKIYRKLLYNIYNNEKTRYDILNNIKLDNDL